MRVANVTSQWACFALWGPHARDDPRRLHDRRPRDDAFPYMTCADIDVGDVPVRALRVTYVGELGWELYCPTEFGAALWRTLWEAGEEHGLVAGGYRAIDSLRLEKGYRVWGADITPDEHPFQAGLGFAVKLDKGEFLGREALVRARADGVGAAALLPRARRPALGRAVQRAGAGRRCRCSAASPAAATATPSERSIAYAYLPAEHAAPGTEVAVEIFGEWVAGGSRASRSTTPRARGCGPRTNCPWRPDRVRPIMEP